MFVALITDPQDFHNKVAASRRTAQDTQGENSCLSIPGMQDRVHRFGSKIGLPGPMPAEFDVCCSMNCPKPSGGHQIEYESNL